MSRIDEVLEFWFGSGDDPFERAEKWWEAGEEFDAEIERKFGSDIERVAAGQLDVWLDTPRGTLAYVIVLDQFSRNIHRDAPEMYAHDELALQTAVDAIERSDDEQLEPIERQFLYMPLMHAEDREIQRRCLELFDQLRSDAPDEQREAFDKAYEFAVTHAEIVEKFGRFPHRNEILGRESTDAERAFLDEHGRGF
jgi:uncharacterized protein (DUF924 family)